MKGDGYMRDRYFNNYGKLKWLEPSDYFAGPWKYVGFSITDDVEDDNECGQYDLVRHTETMEMRYTNI